MKCTANLGKKLLAISETMGYCTALTGLRTSGHSGGSGGQQIVDMRARTGASLEVIGFSKLNHNSFNTFRLISVNRHLKYK